MEHHLSEILQWFFMLLLILMVTSLVILGKEINDINAFKQYVNTSIERRGGYTTQAASEIENYSEAYYRSLFEIDSISKTGQLNYGEVLDYQIKGTFPVAFFQDASFTAYFEGTTISKLRSN